MCVYVIAGLWNVRGEEGSARKGSALRRWKRDDRLRPLPQFQFVFLLHFTRFKNSTRIKFTA